MRTVPDLFQLIPSDDSKVRRIFHPAESRLSFQREQDFVFEPEPLSATVVELETILVVPPEKKAQYACLKNGICSTKSYLPT